MLDVKDIIELGILATTVIGGYVTMQVKFDRHEKEDEKQFNKFDKYSGEFYDRIGKLEIKGAANDQILMNHTAQYNEIKHDIAEIKTMLLGIIQAK